MNNNTNGTITRFSQSVNTYYESLSKQEKKVADYLLSLDRLLDDASICDIAKNSNTSNATVVRFCKRIGYKGLKELKIALCERVAYNEGAIFWNDSYSQIFSKVFSQSIKSIEESVLDLSSSLLFDVATLISSATHINIIGVGGSSIIADFCKTEFTRLGKHINLAKDVYSIGQLSSPYISPKVDLVIAISCSGETKCIVDAVSSSKTRGTKIIAFTTVDKSSLVSLSDLVVLSKQYHVFCDDFQSYSRIAQMVQVLTIYLMVANIIGKKDESFKHNYVEETNYRKFQNF